MMTIPVSGQCDPWVVAWFGSVTSAHSPVSPHLAHMYSTHVQAQVQLARLQLQQVGSQA
jgi:hypothetical protein